MAWDGEGLLTAFHMPRLRPHVSSLIAGSVAGRRDFFERLGRQAHFRGRRLDARRMSVSLALRMMPAFIRRFRHRELLA